MSYISIVQSKAERNVGNGKGVFYIEGKDYSELKFLGSLISGNSHKYD